jgi:HK97 family phage major capsid protein
MRVTREQVSAYKDALARHASLSVVGKLSDQEVVRKMVREVIAGDLGMDLSNKRSGKFEEEVSKSAQDMTTDVMDSESLARDIPTTFINLMVDMSVLLKNARVYRTTKRAGDMVKIDVTGPVTEKATENGTSTETRRVDATPLSYTTVKSRSQFNVSGEMDEDNIEGPGRGQQTMLNALLTRVGNDMEQLAIEGDTSNVGSDDESRLLQVNDGWHVLTAQGTGAHIVSAGAKRASWKLLEKLLRNLPKKYRRDMGKLRWIVSPNAALDIRGDAAARSTGLGDSLYAGGNYAPHGIPMLEIPSLPEDLAVTGTNSTGTFIWLADPKNFIYVVQRALQVHTLYVPRYDRWEVTAFMRTDFLVENTDAVVKATNIVVDDAVGFYGAA